MSDTKQVQLRLDVSGLPDTTALRWVRDGQEAIEGALEELQNEGADISGEKKPSASGPDARGFGLDDFAFAIAANAVADMLTALLIKMVKIIFQRMHRPNGITLKAGANEIHFDAHESERRIEKRLHSWLSSSLPLEQPIAVCLE